MINTHSTEPYRPRYHRVVDRFMNWFYWHMVPRSERDRIEAQIAHVRAVMGLPPETIEERKEQTRRMAWL